MADRWSVAVFGRNEAPWLRDCLLALARAGDGMTMDVTVLLNGTTDASPAIAVAALREAALHGRVCLIDHADKANAFNQFLYRVRPEAETYFFVDAYAVVAPDALRQLARRLRERPAANGAAALPSTGRSAAALRRRMMEQPGLHGSLFALSGAFMQRLALEGLCLPLGLYRGDGLLGSFAMHDLDAHGGGWRDERLAMVPQATWAAPVLHPWRWRDARRQWRRLLQQARGRLQWLAIRQAIYDASRPADAAGFAALPVDADRLVLDWMAEAPERRPRWWRDPLAALALRRMRRVRLPTPPQLLPRVMAEIT